MELQHLDFVTKNINDRIIIIYLQEIWLYNVCQTLWNQNYKESYQHSKLLDFRWEEFKKDY